MAIASCRAQILYVCDTGNDRIVELSATGTFLRAIPMAVHGAVFGVAYCHRRDVIAVSLFSACTGCLLRYETLEVFATIGTGRWGPADGEMYGPRGLRFTTDGAHILLADQQNGRASKFSASDGSFVAHIDLPTPNEFSGNFSPVTPTDVLQCEDGSIMVAGWFHDGNIADAIGGVWVDGVMRTSDIMSTGNWRSFVPRSLAYSAVLMGVLTKEFTGTGRVLLLPDMWYTSRRCAWISASLISFD